MKNNPIGIIEDKINRSKSLVIKGEKMYIFNNNPTINETAAIAKWYKG